MKYLGYIQLEIRGGKTEGLVNGSKWFQVEKSSFMICSKWMRSDWTDRPTPDFSFVSCKKKGIKYDVKKTLLLKK